MKSDDQITEGSMVEKKGPSDKHRHNKCTRRRVLFCTLTLFAIVSATVLVCFYAFSSCNKEDSPEKDQDSICSYSREAERVGLRAFLEKVADRYFALHPEYISWHPKATDSMIKKRFKIHDPRPENMKKVSEGAEELLIESYKVNPNLKKLKPRELKAYLQVQHYLRFNFGKPWSMYKSGLWLLGPSSFCYEPMCYFGEDIKNTFSAFKPNSENDINKLTVYFKQINQSIHQYIDTLNLGIKTGMVRTQESCKAGFGAFKSLHSEIYRNGSDGVVKQDYTKQFFSNDYYDDVGDQLKEMCIRKFGVDVQTYITSSVRLYIGAAVHKLLKYLETEYYNACRPDKGGPGGLSALPISVVHSNGSAVPGSKTHPFLPLCTGSGCRLNGSASYEMILGYYTTKDIHPSDVNRMGWESLKRIYPQMVEIAKKVTSIEDENKAVKTFQDIILDRKASYFNSEPMPANESNGDAYKKCVSDDTAQKYCPQRWKAMMKWLRFSESVMTMLEGNTVDFFFFTGRQRTTPSCPVKLRVDYTPSNAAQSYQQSDRFCTTPSNYYLPFFLENLGPKYAEYTASSHEARPGHHTQFQGMVENFQQSCGGPEQFLHDFTYYTAFSEGWALYAEYPLMAENSNIYENNLMQKYGMLKWQMWRAARLIVDTGLHYNGLSRKESLQLLRKYVWEYTDVGHKEVTRYQSNPGQATAYLVGQLDIWRLQNQTREKLMDKFSIKEFHYQILLQGSAPLSFLQSHIDKYIRCKLGKASEFCKDVLSPSRSTSSASDGDGIMSNINARQSPINLRRHFS